MPFVGVPDRDAVLREGPQLLDKAVIQLLRPFAFKECACLIAVGREFGAAAP